jgi:hypothetical protein
LKEETVDVRWPLAEVEVDDMMVFLSAEVS